MTPGLSPYPAIAKAKLRAGASANTRGGPDNDPVLVVAARFGDLDVVSALLGADANPDVPDFKNGATALHFASEKGFDGVVFALLEAGASPDLPNSKSGAFEN